MKAKLAAMIAALDRLVNYFIPPEIAADRDARNRAHVFLVSHILGPFIGSVVPIALYVFDPAPGYEVVVLSISIVVVLDISVRVASRRAVQSAGAGLDPESDFLHSLGLLLLRWGTSPTLAWVLVIPLLAFFYLGSSKTLRLIVMTMFAVNLAIFSCFYLFGYPIKNDCRSRRCRAWDSSRLWPHRFMWR